VAEALNVALREPARRGIAEQPTDNLEAWGLYVRAKELSLRFDAEPHHEAIRLLERAVALDHRFALAFALLAREHLGSYYTYEDRTAARLARARAAIDTALLLNPTLADAHTARATQYGLEHRIDDAIREYGIALRHAPSDAYAMVLLAGAIEARGKWKEALRYYERARTLDPRSPYAVGYLAHAYFVRRDHARARAAFDHAIAVAPDLVVIYVEQLRCEFLLGGRPDRARVMLQQALDRFGTAQVAVLLQMNSAGMAADTAQLARLRDVPRSAFPALEDYLGWRAYVASRRRQPEIVKVYADSLLGILDLRLRQDSTDAIVQGGRASMLMLLGRNAEAIRAARESVRNASAFDVENESGLHGNAAVVFAQTGERAAAVEQLEWLLARPSVISANALRVDPAWAPLRGEPRFERLLATAP
jgi:tetratricopeptide (TPR) repeat protein